VTWTSWPRPGRLTTTSASVESSGHPQNGLGCLFTV
jgi:hypothetical protein